MGGRACHPRPRCVYLGIRGSCAFKPNSPSPAPVPSSSPCPCLPAPHPRHAGRGVSLESQFRLTYSMILNLLRVEDMKVRGRGADGMEGVGVVLGWCRCAQ